MPIKLEQNYNVQSKIHVYVKKKMGIEKMKIRWDNYNNEIFIPVKQSLCYVVNYAISPMFDSIY